jgi:hypothetical protein
VFRFAEIFSTSYRYFMTTAEQFREAVAHPNSRDVSIAGVPWPAYKLVALVIGLLVFGAVAVVTASAAPAVLTAAAAATLAWLGLGRGH